MPELKIITTNLAPEKSLIKLSGILDAHTFVDFDQAVQNVFDRNIFKIIIDLGEVTYISSAGAGVFIGCQPTAQDHGGNLVIARPVKSVMEVFNLLGLNELFTIADSVEDAAAKLP